MYISTIELAKTTITRVVRVENGPVLAPAGYRRWYRLDTIRIEYVWKDGQFQVDSTFRISLSGQWVKKDRTNAIDRATGMTPDYVDRRARKWETQYAFLDEIIELLRPANDLSMHAYLDYEVEV